MKSLLIRCVMQEMRPQKEHSSASFCLQYSFLDQQGERFDLKYVEQERILFPRLNKRVYKEVLHS